jgi:hypothetical protein
MTGLQYHYWINTTYTILRDLARPVREIQRGIKTQIRRTIRPSILLPDSFRQFIIS